MFKKSLLITVLALSIVPVAFSEDEIKEIKAGTPAGFYDEITPEDVEREEKELQQEELEELKPVQKEEESYQIFDEDEVIDGLFINNDEAKPNKNYAQIYSNLQMADFSYLHNIDPDQFYDMKDTSWSEYPLFRLMSPLYFKNITIEPGYYLLTPREHEGKWFMLFKQNGRVVHIIPVYERDYTPEMFYDEHLPKPKLTKAQKIHMGVLDFIGKYAKSSKRRAPVQSYLEVNDLENYFVSIIIYYGNHKYSTIFRTVKL